eukprot:2764122-Rhodomonas_salina.1
MFHQARSYSQLTTDAPRSMEFEQDREFIELTVELSDCIETIPQTEERQIDLDATIEIPDTLTPIEFVMAIARKMKENGWFYKRFKGRPREPDYPVKIVEYVPQYATDLVEGGGLMTTGDQLFLIQTHKENQIGVILTWDVEANDAMA